MTFFQLTWVDFKILADKKLKDESEIEEPLSYLDDGSSFFIFKPRNGIIYYTQLIKEELEDEEGFRTLQLRHAVVLVRLPYPLNLNL